MKRLSIAFVFATMICAVGVATSGPQDRDRNDRDDDRSEPSDAKVHHARGEAGHNAGGSPLLVYHGGPVMTTGAYVEPIFWGTSWDPALLGDKQTGLRTFYDGMGGSAYEATTTEYTQSGGGHVGTAVTLGPSHVDSSAVPRRIGNNTSPILAEACKKATNLMTDGYYPVYVDARRGNAGFCAWHSAGTCPNGVTIQFAFFFNLDGDAGCDPQDTSGKHSQGLAALANVSGHELSETLTDQHLNGWTDASGSENADKCAWSFGTPLLTFTGGSQWKVQGNWSNAAFNGGTGFANSSGQKGCLDGGNYK
jgi:hypothetical protein